jgi:branched-chain amino acid transport system ATP-binding protein
MIEINSLDVFYGGIQALSKISLKVWSEDIVCLIGANGAGKTTLLNSISRFVRPRSGEIRLDGKDLLRLSPRDVVLEGIVQIPEGREIFDDLTVAENLELGAYLRFSKDNSMDIRKDFEGVLRLFPLLEARLTQMAGTLSGGEQQMLAIGRGLMSKPRFLLMDEPSLGLAPLVANEIFRTIGNLSLQRVGILLVEQNARAALRISRRCCVMKIGRIVMSGLSTDLVNDEIVMRSFLGVRAEDKRP